MRESRSVILAMTPESAEGRLLVPLAALLTVALPVAVRVVVTLVAMLTMLTMGRGSPQPAAARDSGRDALAVYHVRAQG